MMRRVAMLLLLAPFAARAEEFVDAETGLVVDVPEGWDRESQRERGAIRFAALYDVTRTKKVRFQIEAGPAAHFDADAWLEAEERSTRKVVSEETGAFTRDRERRVGGKSGAAYTFSGKVQQGEEAYDLRWRVCGIVHGDIFFKITELSYRNAHDGVEAPLEGMWRAIRFQDGKPRELDLGAPAGLEAGNATDEKGNYKLKLLPGWVVTREAPLDDKGPPLRMTFARQTKAGNVVCRLSVWRFTSGRAEDFTTETPSTILERYHKDTNLFEQYYGQGSKETVRPTIDESRQLGDAEKSAAFGFKSRTMEELKEIQEAEDLKRRGDKTVVVPNPLPLVLRGRIALLSPHVYILIANFRRSAANNPDLVKEFNQVLDSFEFLSSDAKPSPINVGDTLSDPTLGKDRKSKNLVVESGLRKPYKLEVKFVVPAGFKRITNGVPRAVSVMVAGQDKDNNWVTIEIAHMSILAAGEKRMVPQQKPAWFESKRSGWSNKARRTRFPRKPAKWSAGQIRGAGYKFVEGRVEKFRGTFSVLLSDKSGWRHMLSMETRGNGDKVFQAQIKKFLKSIKIKPLKK